MNPNSDKRRLILLLVVILTAGSVASSGLAFRASKQTARDSALKNELPLTGDSVDTELQRGLLRPIAIAEQMAQDTFLRDWAISGETNPDLVVRYLAGIQDHYSATTSFFVSDRTRNHYQPDGIVQRVAESDPEDAWYFRVREMLDPYELNIGPDGEAGVMTTYINYRVTDYEGNFIGVAGVGLPLADLDAMLQRYPDSFDRYVYLVDAEGTIVAAGEDVKVGGRLADRIRDRDVEATILASEQPEALRYERDGRQVLVNSRFVPDVGWHLVVEQDEASLAGASRTTLLLNLAIGLGVTALVVFVTLLTVNRYQRKLRLAASVDDLTGLANRREGQSMLADAMTEADVKDQKLAAVLVDIDHFKGINDEHGHPTGDRVINGVGGLLRSAVRQDDRVIRWGGDEYLVLLRGCPHNEAVRLGRAMLGNVATQHLLVGATLPPLTVSIGVTEYQVGESREAFLARADRALHRAKANGRNCVHGMRPREGELSQADIADLVAFDVPLHDRSATASEEARQDRRNGPVARRLLRR